MSRTTLLRGGVVHSPAHSYATALTTDGPTITWVGDEDSAGSLVDDVDHVVDLRGALVTPTFVDAHAHLAQTGLAGAGVRLQGLPSRQAVLDAVATHATTGDGVVLGFGWDETLWDDPRPVTGAELDRAANGRPVYLARVDVHSAIVSGALVDACPQITGLDGWSATGRVERSAHHAARAAADALVTEPQRRAAIRSALRTAATQGIGLVHELGAPHLSQLDDFGRIDAIRSAEPLPQVARYWGEVAAYDQARAVGAVGLAGDLCVDGAIGSRTAALHEPYADAATCGHAYLSVEQVRDHVIGCTRAGLQAGFHAIGDRGVATVFAGLVAARDEVGTDALRRARHRVEHLEMVDAAQVALAAQLGLTASVQPAFDAAWGGADGLYARRLGAERAAGMNPFGALSRAGVPLAFGSDTPVTPFDPWAAVRAAAWHHDPGQRISVQTAFVAHTRGGWRAIGADDAGVLVPGSPATFAVWDVPSSTDLRAAGGPGLPDLAPGQPLPTCLATVVDGTLVHEREGALQ